MSSSDSLVGLNAVVVGASKGIGKAIAEALAAEGCNLALLSRSTPSLPPTKNIHYIQCDVLSDSSMDTAIRKIGEIFGNRVDILVNNAGVGGKGINAFDAEWEDWERVLNTDLRGLMRVTKLVLPFMKDVGRGAIVNIASIAGKKANPNNVDYCTAKHGVIGFSNTLFEDVRERGIKVCAINPGYVNTPLVEHVKADKSKMIQPEDIARTVVFVCKFPDSGCPTEITVRPQRSPTHL